MSICSCFRVFCPQITHSFCCKNTINLNTQFISKSAKVSSFQSKKSRFSSLISVKKQSKSSISATSVTPACLQSLEELPSKLQNIIKLFKTVQEPRAKYEQLLYYGKNLTPLANEFKTKENKVEGCVSQVWVRAFLDEENMVWFEADSDSVLTKGLAALLVEGLSGNPPPEIVKVSPDFIQMLGLKQSLTPSRNNGFLNMLKLMQRKALQLYMDRERVSNGNSVGNSENNEVFVMEDRSQDVKLDQLGSEDDKHDETRLNSNGLFGRRERIRKQLEMELEPVELEVADISHFHAGHVGTRVEGEETHFNVKIVSKKFEGKSLVKRHRLVYGLLQEELQNGLHALSIIAKTPSEVDSR